MLRLWKRFYPDCGNEGCFNPVFVVEVGNHYETSFVCREHLTMWRNWLKEQLEALEELYPANEPMRNHRATELNFEIDQITHLLSE